MAGLRPDDPSDLLGAYRELGDVPDRHRLRQHAEAYRGRDVWAEWVGSLGLGEHGRELAERHGRDWKAHMDGRHHALATPGDVHDYAGRLLKTRSGRVAAEYWRRVASFHRHLLQSTDHPHVYNPLLIAANAGGPAAEMWRVARDER